MDFRPTKAFSEAMLQAEFYLACKQQGLLCYLEYHTRRNGKQGCRFDAVVVKDSEVIAIIEMKAYKYPQQGEYWWLRLKQHAKYHQFNVPVFLVACLTDVQIVIDQVVSKS